MHKFVLYFGVYRSIIHKLGYSRKHVRLFKDAMEREIVNFVKRTSDKRLKALVISALMVSVLSGCTQVDEGTEKSVTRLFGITDGLTDAQTRLILAGETVLIVFLVSLIILLIALFNRYRKTEKRAIEASLREKALVRENEVLDRLNRTKTEFFQNMSHDFKTPLTVISTSVLNAIDTLDYEMDKDEIRESLNLAQSEIMRMSRIVDGALKHAALHSNRQTSEPIDLSLVMRKVAKTYHVFLQRNGNELSITIPPGLPRVYGNSDMLLNVFSNLIANANRFTRNGSINISADYTGMQKLSKSELKYVNVSVSDTGAGVSPEILDDIFTRGASESGTGLGLSICKAAIETYGGEISVASDKGKGTKVSFTLPVYEKISGDDEDADEVKRRI